MKVTLYKTTSCPYCHQETEWLKERQIPFEEIYIDRDQDRAVEIQRKSGQLGVPITEIASDGKTEYVLGFDQAKLSQLLKLAS